MNVLLADASLYLVGEMLNIVLLLDGPGA